MDALVMGSTRTRMIDPSVVLFSRLVVPLKQVRSSLDQTDGSSGLGWWFLWTRLVVLLDQIGGSSGPAFLLLWTRLMVPLEPLF